MATYDNIIAYAPLAAFLQNRDTATQMPDIVRRAQTYVTRRLDHDFFRQSLPATTADAAGLVTYPIDESTILEVRSVSIGIGSRRLPIPPRDYDMLVSLYHDAPRGQPRHWAYNPGNQIQLFPAPGRVLDVFLSANVMEPVLAPGQQENRLSVEYPEIMEQAVALHVALFNLDPTATQMYSEQVGELLMTANSEISRQRRDETAQRPMETRNVTGS
jgi:hypothetical protein